MIWKKNNKNRDVHSRVSSLKHVNDTYYDSNSKLHMNEEHTHVKLRWCEAVQVNAGFGTTEGSPPHSLSLSCWLARSLTHPHQNEDFLFAGNVCSFEQVYVTWFLGCFLVSFPCWRRSCR